MPRLLATAVADGVAYLDELVQSQSVLAQSTTVAANRAALVASPFEVSSSVTLTIASTGKLVVI